MPASKKTIWRRVSVVGISRRRRRFAVDTFARRCQCRGKGKPPLFPIEMGPLDGGRLHHHIARMQIAVNKIVNENHFEKGPEQRTGEFPPDANAFFRRIFQKIGNRGRVDDQIFHQHLSADPTFEGSRKEDLGFLVLVFV